MKHLFVIHSNTVLLSALGAINYEKINHQDAIFFYGRNFKSSIAPDNINKIDISEVYHIGLESGFSRSKASQEKLLENVDQTINNYVNDNFIVYLPHTGIPFFQAIITNDHCRGICLLQEGACTFFSKNLSSPIKAFLLNCFFSTNRLWWQTSWSVPIFMRNKIRINKTYSLDPTLYKYLENSTNIKIQWPEFNLPDGIVKEGAHIFLFESAVELGYIEKDVFMEGCEKLIKENAKNGCFVKFHPNQDLNNRKYILDMFGGVDVREVSDLVPFELIMSSVHNLYLYGFTTSLLTFGKNLGHHVISYSDFLCSRSNKFKAYCKTLS